MAGTPSPGEAASETENEVFPWLTSLSETVSPVPQVVRKDATEPGTGTLDSDPPWWCPGSVSERRAGTPGAQDPWRTGRHAGRASPSLRANPCTGPTHGPRGNHASTKQTFHQKLHVSAQSETDWVSPVGEIKFHSYKILNKIPFYLPGNLLAGHMVCVCHECISVVPKSLRNYMGL